MGAAWKALDPGGRSEIDDPASATGLEVRKDRLIGDHRAAGVDADDPLPILIVEPWDGFPTPAELVARYGEKSGRDVSRADWYAVLACYKLAILLEGSFARACAGKAPPEIGARMHASAIRLLGKAGRLAAG